MILGRYAIASKLIHINAFAALLKCLDVFTRWHRFNNREMHLAVLKSSYYLTEYGMLGQPRRIGGSNSDT